MALRQTLSTGTSESSIIFFNGGHNHNGTSSALIDTSKYSIYDFTTDFLGTSARQEGPQAVNAGKFEEVVARIVKEKVLTIAGIKLLPNEVQAVNISAGAVTANALAANIVLVNNVIRSNNFDGTVLANGTITTSGTTGWAISGQGQAVFDTSFIRGSLTASSVSTPGIDIDSNGNLTANNFSLYANGFMYASGGNFQVDASGNLYAENATIYGEINATSGSVSGDLVSGGTISGVELQIGSNFAVDAFGNLSAENASISGTITTGSITGDLTLTNTGQVLGPGQVNVYGVMADIIIANGEFALGNNIGIKSLGNFSTTSSSTTARIHAPGSGGEIIRGPSSLRELKYNIQDINNALDILNQIRPRQYNWHIDGIDKLDPTTNEPWSDEAREIADLSISYGFIAQEIGEDCPALTVYKSPSLDLPKDQPGGYYDLNAWTPAMWKEMDMIPLLVKAVQELSEKVQSLEARLTEIEG